ncbi:glutaminyl-peptide cyclotransferase-like [Pomacea canaliculata]|uniref:glutaminyl-peptide cyclotransferase-like n=1 Tax=Pomacea canaliculata TaxID=400727 RepID=UPI000D7260F5|nr:glutaminyl-peptide cyclotransferase-like [Pomacea canaliculata]
MHGAAPLAEWLCLLLLCWTRGQILAQRDSCRSIESNVVRNNLGDLAVGLSRRGQFREYALRPFLQPRVPDTPGSTTVRNHITTWMSSVGWTVEEDSFQQQTPFGTRRFTNVIATLDPSKSRRIVLACHYDSKLYNNMVFIGATDSAVPCALMLETALRMQNHFRSTKESNSDLTLQFVFFDGEEALMTWSQYDSLYGSKHLAAKWADTPDPNNLGLTYIQTIEQMILMDLIGTPDTSFDLQFAQTASSYYKLRNIEQCLQQHGYLNPTQRNRPIFTNRRARGGVEDDHIPFLERRVPIVHLISSPFPSVWHTVYDNIRALDFTLIDNLARILRIFLADLPL